MFFLVVVFLLHWYFTSKTRLRQNVLLLLSSFLFYSFWDWRFLIPLLFSIFLDFYIGKLIFKHRENIEKKKMLLFISLFVNLGFLFFFKYFNFFLHNLYGLFLIFDWKANYQLLEIMLPIGISFYTFHGLSYVIDIYNDKIEPETDIINYALFVNFFPLLVAGPIERATHLLPQLTAKRKFDYDNAVNGLKQVLWGFTKKIIIADNCAEYVNLIFENYTTYNGSTLLIGAILFSFQIYGDFSGYTDIALGVARFFGIELLKNFSYPYFSRSMVEFWHKWHISLSSWFRDYLYIPLGGSRVSTFNKYRNIFLVFLISGFWHGANFTFLFWGFLNAIFYIISSIAFGGKIYAIRNDFNFKNISHIGLTFFLVTFCWIFFRSENLLQAFTIVKTIFSVKLFEVPSVFPKTVFILIAFFLGIEWKGRENKFAIENLRMFENKIIRYLFYYVLVVLIMYYFGKDFQFIYFQF